MSLLPPTLDYTKFFGDPDLALQEKLSKPAIYAWPLLEQIDGLHRAYHAICQLRNVPMTDVMMAQMTPAQYGQRQALLDLARKLIWNERNKLLNEFVELSPKTLRLPIG